MKDQILNTIIKILHKMAHGLVSVQGWPLNKGENDKERQTWDCCRLAAAT